MSAPKIRGASFDALKAAIEKLDTEERREAYRTGQFPRADKVNDIQVRYRWDLFYAVRGRNLLRAEVADGLADWNDSHIDTALRRIVPALVL